MIVESPPTAVPPSQYPLADMQGPFDPSQWVTTPWTSALPHDERPREWVRFEVLARKPGAWALIGSTELSTNTEACTGNTSVASSTAAAALVQFGVAYKATSGSFGQGDVWMQVATDAWGTIVGRVRQQLATDSSTKQILAVTPWIPAIYADKVKMTIATSQIANLTLQPTFQIATTLTNSANAWETDTTDWTPSCSTVTTNQESNTGELAPNSIADAMWIRFGVAFWLNAGTRGQCDVDVSVAVRTV